MGHRMTLLAAAIASLALSSVAIPAADGRADPREKTGRRAEGAAGAGMVSRAPARFPPIEALGAAATPQGALALWRQFSPVLHERMLRADKGVVPMVMAPLNGADMSASDIKTESQRGIALAQIQATCATFLSVPGIPMTAEERDLLATYAARVGAARQPGQGSH